MKIKIVRNKNIVSVLNYLITIQNLQIYDIVNGFYLEKNYDMVIHVNDDYIKILTGRFSKRKIIKRNKLKI